MFETEKQKEKAILVASSPEDESAVKASLDELELLVETSGGESLGRMSQKRDSFHPAHYLGTGKLDELASLVLELGAEAVVCDDELTASQIKNMAKRLDVKVLDRTMVILDIFASRALSSEGKAQVELAQLKHRLSHLTGIGAQMSKLLGGIGVRGPGESKLETDRRHIRNRITQLNRELEEIEKQRSLLSQKRKKAGTPLACLVGYTNSGKSTLMNALTEAGVLAEDKLFATLDTTTRKVDMPEGGELLLSDTVGFIQKLPHNLIQAFRATLEQLKDADILLHVADASNPACETQMQVVYETLDELGLRSKPVITVFNKMDLEGAERRQDSRAAATVLVSAKNKENLDKLAEKIAELIKAYRIKETVLLPYSEGALVKAIHDRCEILEEDYKEDGTLITAFLDQELSGRLQRFVLKP
ncbi:MAG: GTPase HflX [Clostridiales bacterium]|nr:GTPase HflX [Clostridiales bacterium]MDR2751116.1 GTPase HflX [Clostridiales bacterium]